METTTSRVPMDDEKQRRQNRSDSDSQQDVIEVLFDKQQDKRRRASMVARTSCFVHTLLEKGGDDDGDVRAAQTKYDRLGDKNAASAPHTQSRLLTKTQLSDVAFDIREMSKKLSRFRLMLKVRNVFILTKVHDKSLILKAKSVTEWLLQQKNPDGQPYNVWVEETMRDNDAFDAPGIIARDETCTHRLRYWTTEMCRSKPQTFEICLCLGGDGTVLYASWLFQRIVPPVLSFALGSLGFLTKFDFCNYPVSLTRAFAEGVTVSLRLRFEATVMRSKDRDAPAGEQAPPRDLVEELVGEHADDSSHSPCGRGSLNVMNDIVLDRGPNPTMSSIEIFGGDEYFTVVQADGVCVATPTGSTAYNLAAGGSLCHPENPVMLVTAIAPHTLSFRPIILPDSTVLRLGVPYDARASCWASFDGKERTELKPGDYVTISASRFPFPSVLPLDRKGEDWVDSISRTLNWNNRQRQKRFDDAAKEGGGKD